MIGSLRRKFILIAMLSMLGTMAVLCTMVGVGSCLMETGRTDRAISLLYQSGGSFHSPAGTFDPSSFDFQVTPETPFEMRYVIVELTAQQEVMTVNTEHIAALDRQAAIESIDQIVSSGRDHGYVGYYRFQVFRDEGGGSTIIMLDCFRQIQAIYNMLRIMLLVVASCVVIVFILLLFFSKRAIRPIVENLERQRQFVTDASHELKTPLAILSADMGLLEDACGKNKWLESAQAQVFRLDKLIRNLVELARTEETVKEDHISFFSVSEIAQAAEDAFRPMAESGGKTLTAEIAPDLHLRGIQDNLFRLFTILLDNAVKYCDQGGNIHLVLFQKGRNICISVSNPCMGLDAALLPRYFDRFYRADASRDRATGGYGIGLSTARAIVTRHRGHISNRYTNGTITFTAVIPQAG